ncbi:MAG: glycosyl hydrolase family 28 protein [Spirochaetota bacterium]
MRIRQAVQYIAICSLILASPFAYGKTIIPIDTLEGPPAVKSVASPETSFEVDIKTSAGTKIEGEGAVGMKFKRIDQKGPGDYIRLDMNIPRGTLDLTKGTAYIHFMGRDLPAGGSFYLLLESPGANAVMQLTNFRSAAGEFRAVALFAAELLTLPGTKTKIDPSAITRIFLGIASVPVGQGGIIYLDAITDTPLAPLMNPLTSNVVSAATNKPALPQIPGLVIGMRIVTNTPYRHARKFDDLEDRTSVEIRSYPAPAGAPVAEGRKASLIKNGKAYDIPLYTTPVWGGITLHGSIDCNQGAVIELAVPGATSAVVRPLSKKISAAVADNKIRFDVPGPGKYIVEVNDSIDDAVNIFVNPIEKNPITASNNASVIYFGPGFHENVGAIVPTNGQTVYIAAGAYLHHARISIRDSDNVVIRGRGIVDTEARFNGYKKDPSTTHCLSAWNANGLTVEGITFLDAETFCTVYRKSHDVRIRNVKVIARDGNTDQNDIVGCQRVHISDVFYRGYDDGIVIKVAIEVKDLHSHDILAENSVIWTDLAHPLTVGTEVLNNVYNVMFTNIDILHVRQPAHKSRALAIHVGDNGTVHDVTFTDIRIESIEKALVNGFVDLIQLEIKPNVYSKTKLPGHMRNITFRNIELLSAPNMPLIDIKGHGPENTVEGITFENIRLFGTNVHGYGDMNIATNQFVKNIRVIDEKGTATTY